MCACVSDSLQGWEKVSNVFWWVSIISNWGNLGKGGLGMWGWGVENRKKKKLSVGPMKLEIPVRSQREIFWTGALKGGLSERHKFVDQPSIKIASKATNVDEVIESERTHRNEMSQGWILRNCHQRRDHKHSQDFVDERGESPFRNVPSEWPPPLSFLVRNSYVFVSYFCCNQLSQIQWLKTIQTY